MDSFARDLFNFAAGLSRAQAKYDSATPKERELLECIQCGGKGKLGCNDLCDNGGNEAYAFCLKHHTCSRCNGTGDDPLQDETEREAKDAADEARWDSAREDRMGEDKQEEGGR